MEEQDYTNMVFYWFNESKISADDFIRLEQVATIENEKMQHKIFLGFRYNDWPPNFICLN